MFEQLRVANVEKAIGIPRDKWANRCHEVAYALLVSSLMDDVTARMARGWAQGISSQHSWIVTGNDVYDKTAKIIDPTYASNRGSRPMIMIVDNLTSHSPHGYGEFSKFPESKGGKEFLPEFVSPSTRLWADMASMEVGPLDAFWWAKMFSGPMGGWPSRELVNWAYEEPALRALIPIDIVGMLTDRNPRGLYLRPSIDST